jgi:hypothetical protein
MHLIFSFILFLCSNWYCCLSGGQESKEYITFEQFGVKGNGTDETAAMLRAFDFAKKNKTGIKLLDGKTYKFSPQQPVDITGIPFFSGSGTFDLTKTGKAAGYERMLAVFHAEGRKKKIQNTTVTVKKGSSSVMINKGLDLINGDILFVTSSENLPNMKRPYYCKGQRCKVKHYNPKTGELKINEPFFYDIQAACLWLHEYIPEITIGKDLRFITSEMNFITCFRLYYAKANISGYYKNFALTAIMYKSSFGEVNQMEAELPLTDNNGYSHCVEIADMSDVTVKNCKLTGGRHVISGVGGGLWKKDECGGSGAAGYPSVFTVDGGIYRGVKGVNNITPDNATIDAHGLVENMIIKNCTVYGGINLGSKEATVTNVTIYCDEKRIFNVGSDVDADAVWGNYKISNCTFYADGNSNVSLIYAKANIQKIEFRDITVSGISDKAVFMDFKYFTPQEILISNNKFKGKVPSGNYILYKGKPRITISSSSFNLSNTKKVW